MTPKLNEAANRGQKISVLVAISISAVLSFCIDVDAINENSFTDLTEFQKFPPIGGSNIIIIDKERIHKVRKIKALLSHNTVRFEYLPTYSLQLNPIEEYFSKFENSTRRMRNETLTRQQLKDIALEILETDRECNMRGYFRHENVQRNRISTRTLLKAINI
ncbi:hypothetical protein RF11_01791 [Thelohanellus kitauei]|uniref:Tc1-like transposase DDE domain-containing protein n=1 Tax=Thelohanellus kitauei TaxID=669202 RepID=A0A0C2NCY9_THEKT|nr:hypothetical protein RF11_01791 [Thelohanellus kitauei]